MIPRTHFSHLLLTAHRPYPSSNAAATPGGRLNKHVLRFEALTLQENSVLRRGRFTRDLQLHAKPFTISFTAYDRCVADCRRSALRAVLEASPSPCSPALSTRAASLWSTWSRTRSSFRPRPTPPCRRRAARFGRWKTAASTAARSVAPTAPLSTSASPSTAPSTAPCAATTKCKSFSRLLYPAAAALAPRRRRACSTLSTGSVWIPPLSGAFGLAAFPPPPPPPPPFHF